MSRKKAAKKTKPVEPMFPGISPDSETPVGEVRARIMPMGNKCFGREELELILMEVAQGSDGPSGAVTRTAYHRVQLKLDQIYGTVRALANASGNEPNTEHKV